MGISWLRMVLVCVVESKPSGVTEMLIQRRLGKVAGVGRLLGDCIKPG